MPRVTPKPNLARHRNLFNVDCNSWFYAYRKTSAFYRPPKHRWTARDIHDFVARIADGGVDTLVVNPNTELAWYPSKTLPTPFDEYKRGDRSYFLGHIVGHAMTDKQLADYLTDTTLMMDRYLDLAEAGVDWLAETVKACREHKLAPWASIRMNDMHGATKLPEASYMNGTLFKNPAMRLRGTGPNRNDPPSGGWAGLNFAKREVRGHMLALIREPIEDYGYEGLEIDWTRWPLCLEPDPPQSAIDMITEWHGQIRKLTQRQAERIGKPIPMGVRFLGTLDQNRSVGLDFRAMVREGIFDFIEPTNSWQTSWDTPIEELRAELPGVAIYGVVELGPNWLHGHLPHIQEPNILLGKPNAVSYRLQPACPPLMRGNAAAKLVLGCDGISVMNFMPGDQTSHWPWPDEPCAGDLRTLKRLDDLATLRGKPKAYTLPSQTGYWRHELFETAGPFPGVLGPGERRVCQVPMCAEPANSGMELIVQVVVEKKDPLPPIGVSFNGAWPRFDATRDERLLFPVASMTHLSPELIGLNFTFPVSAIRDGRNEVTVIHGTAKDFWADQSSQAVRVESLELAVRAKAGRTRGSKRTVANVADTARVT